MKTVTLISKEDCHLCDVANKAILNVQKKKAFTLEVIKIVPGDAYFSKYHERIPVVLIGGEFAFQYKVSERLLLERLENEEH